MCNRRDISLNLTNISEFKLKLISILLLVYDDIKVLFLINNHIDD